MKKVLVILSVVLVICIVIAVIFNVDSLKRKDRLKNYNPTFYRINVKLDNSIENNTSKIEENNIKVEFKSIYFENINEEKISNIGLNSDEISKAINDSRNADLNYFVEISTINKTNMNELIFEYLIYDNNNNLLASNMGVCNHKVPNYKSFFRKYICEKENIITKMQSNFNLNVIRDNLNATLYLITANNKKDVLQENIDLSKVHLLITGINYKDENSNVIDLYDKIYEFIIEK